MNRLILAVLFTGSLWAQSLPTTNLVRDWNIDNVAGSAGDSIGTITDSISGCAATQATFGKQPYLFTNAPGSNGHRSLMFWEPSTQQLNIGSCLSIANASSYSIFVIGRPHTIDNGSACVMVNVGTDQGRFYTDNYAHLGYYGLQADAPQNGLAAPSSVTLLGMTSSGSSLRFYTNEATATSSSFANTNTLTGGVIGSDGTGNFCNMEIYRVLIYSPEISSGNLTALRAYVNATYGSASARRTIVAAGNSITDGYLPSGLGYMPWPSQMADAMRSDVRIYNIGFAGQTTTGMITAAPTHGTPLCGQTGKDLAFLWEGTNDLLLYDAATSYAHMMSLAALYKAAGCVPIIGTTIPAQQLTGATPTSKEPDRLAYNVLLLAQQTYPVIDLASLSQFSNTADTTYFHADGTHLTNAGEAVVASAVLAVLKDAGTSFTNVPTNGVNIQ